MKNNDPQAFLQSQWQASHYGRAWTAEQEMKYSRLEDDAVINCEKRLMFNSNKMGEE